MLGVLKRRWKPKRASGTGKQEQPTQEIAVPEKPRPPSSARQIHPLVDDKAQLVAYETTKPPPSSPAEPPPPPAAPQPPPPPTYPLTPNIVVEGGRIEFAKTPPDVGTRPAPSGFPAPPLGVATRAQQTTPDEKCDAAKESLEKRVLELERALEAEQRNGQRERLALTRLQRQLARREVLQRDVDRERRLRLDTEVRLRDSSIESEHCRARLAALHTQFTRMEETVRSMLQYKARAEQMKQEKTSLTVAYETRIHQFQNTITKLGQENEALKKQIKALEAAVRHTKGAGEVQNTLLERLSLLEADNSHLTKEAEVQRNQYERCLDDVANQVVRALLSQKDLREEIVSLQMRIKELESQNTALTSILVQQLGTPSGEEHRNLAPVTLARMSRDAPSGNITNMAAPTLYSPGVPETPLTSETSISTPSTGDLATPEEDPARARLRRHPVLGRLWEEMKYPPSVGPSVLTSLAGLDPVLWLPLQRPRSLNLQVNTAIAIANINKRRSRPLFAHFNTKKPVVPAMVAGEDEGSESPESGNRDEGYSTMSSDVQGDSVARAAGDSLSASDPRRGLEDLTEESDTVGGSSTPAPAPARSPSTRLLVVEDAADPDVFYIPLGLALGLTAGNPRHSFPPAKDLLPYQHIMRSFSDSQLCLKLTAAISPYDDAGGNSPYSLSSAAASSTASMLLLDLMAETHPLRRTRATPSLLGEEAGDCEDEEEGWWDTDYVQHWLRLDDTRCSLQQRHRDLVELEYDRAELEDWSMSLSCEDIADWRRPVVVSSLPEHAVTPGLLPSIQENNALELEEDASECLWNNASYLADKSNGELAQLLLNGDAREHGGVPGEGPRKAGWPYGGPVELCGSYSLASPGGSWSSTGTNSEDCCHSYDCSYAGCPGGGYDNSSKRSSAAMSGCSDDAVSVESPAVGTDFTRDFYRLVKFESTKSLASTSSRSLVGNGNASDVGGSLNRRQGPEVVPLKVPSCDREQALQSVLNFIAEQQQYCASREEQDSSVKERPSSLSHEEHFEREPTSTADGGCDSCKRNSAPCGTDRPLGCKDRARVPPLTDETGGKTETVDNLDRCKNGAKRGVEDAPLIKSVHIECGDKLEVSRKIKLPDIVHFDKRDGGAQIHTIIQLETIERLYPDENEVRHLSNKKDRRSEELLLNEQNFSSARNVQGSNRMIIQDPKSIRCVVDFRPTHRHTSTDVDVGVVHAHLEQSPSLKSSVFREEDGVIVLVDALCKNVPQPSGDESRLDNNSKVVDTSVDIKSVSGCRDISLHPFEGEERSELCPSASCRMGEILVTVIEEDDEHAPSEVSGCREMSESLTSTVSTPDTVVSPGVRRKQPPHHRRPQDSPELGPPPDVSCPSSGSSVIVLDPTRAASFHERATSKDVIDELNRMIRKGEEAGATGGAPGAAEADRLDLAGCCPTGWVHVEPNIDFSDPKARANLLDEMLPSSGSSNSSGESGDEPADYQHLHRLHRFRRQKKASATRVQPGVLRCPAPSPRPSILGRDDFYVRYGDKEREAVASFDFLEDLSAASSVSGASSSCDGGSSSRRRRHNRRRREGAEGPAPGRCGAVVTTTTPSSEEADDCDDDRTGEQISSCTASPSESCGSLENQVQ